MYSNCLTVLFAFYYLPADVHLMWQVTLNLNVFWVPVGSCTNVNMNYLTSVSVNNTTAL